MRNIYYKYFDMIGEDINKYNSTNGEYQSSFGLHYLNDNITLTTLMGAAEYVGVNMVEIYTNARDVFENKADIYQTEDPFHNFNQAMLISGRDRGTCLQGFALKHVISLRDMLRDKIKFTPEKIEEVFIDLLNYMVMYRCMVEHYNEEETISVA